MSSLLKRLKHLRFPIYWDKGQIVFTLGGMVLLVVTVAALLGVIIWAAR